MTNRCFCTFICTTAAMLVAIGASSLSADDIPNHSQNDPAVSDPAVLELAARIDEHIEAVWQNEQLQPAEPASDAEFLRRTWLNLAGTIPPAWDVRAFLADDAPDKRLQLVNRLLEHPGFINHQAHIWRRTMIPEAEQGQQARLLVPGFESWLRDQFIDGASYDELARELITCRIAGNRRDGPGSFYRVKDVEPENVAASVSRLFLGIQLDCAQCHDHPFSSWKREEFWQFTAFFSGIQGQQLGDITDDTTRREIAIPDTETVVVARFIDRTTPQWQQQDRSRDVLAEWVTSNNNPWFAQAGANRVWAQMFGIGLVDPPDGFDESNPASHPELLQELGDAFAAHNYDIRFLIRAITASRAYQLSSVRPDSSQNDREWLAQMPVRGLTARQLSNSLHQATGVLDQSDPRQRAFNNGSTSTIESVFEGATSSAVDPQTSILQALALMNGSFVAQQTHLHNSRTLAAVVESPFLNTEEKLEALFLAALTRPPTDKERQELGAFVESGKTAESDEQPQRLADVFWAMLNSSEFRFNH